MVVVPGGHSRAAPWSAYGCANDDDVGSMQRMTGLKKLVQQVEVEGEDG